MYANSIKEDARKLVESLPDSATWHDLLHEIHVRQASYVNAVSQAFDFDNDEQIDAAFREGVHDALREHKRLGQSVVVWQDGKIVTLAPEDIPVELTH